MFGGIFGLLDGNAVDFIGALYGNIEVVTELIFRNDWLIEKIKHS